MKDCQGRAPPRTLSPSASPSFISASISATVIAVFHFFLRHAVHSIYVHGSLATAGKTRCWSPGSLTSRKSGSEEADARVRPCQRTFLAHPSPAPLPLRGGPRALAAAAPTTGTASPGRAPAPRLQRPQQTWGRPLQGLSAAGPGRGRCRQAPRPPQLLGRMAPAAPLGPLRRALRRQAGPGAASAGAAAPSAPLQAAQSEVEVATGRSAWRRAARTAQAPTHLAGCRGCRCGPPG